MSPRFDSYTATAKGVDPAVFMGVAEKFLARGDYSASARGYHHFEEKMAYRGSDGAEWASILWGGKNSKVVMMEVKGERTPEVVGVLRQRLPEHRCTRVDSCVDFDESGAWDKLIGQIIQVKEQFGLRGEKRGDWDYPEDGRTQYLGAPSSAVRVRLYEKGKQPEYRHLERFNWVRLEAQVRPVKEARNVYSSVSASDVWGASGFTRDLCARVLHMAIKPCPAGTTWKLSKEDQALQWMCKQYGKALVNLANTCGGWKEAGLTLGEMVKETSGRASRLRIREICRDGE